MILPTYTVTVNGNARTAAWNMYYDETCTPDVAAMHFLQHGGIEPEVTHLLLRVLQEGDLAVDVGANIGFLSLLMSRLVGKTGRVLAIEPGTNNLGKLKQNIGLNVVSNIEMFEGAAWHEDADIDFYMHADGGRNACVPDPKSLSRSRVPARKLDTLLPDRVPKVIKIDAEGAEHAILRGSILLLDMVPYWVVELNQCALAQFKLTRQDVRDFMRKRNYLMFLLRRDGELPTFVPHKTELKSEIENLNVLFSNEENISKAWPEVQLD